MDPVCLTPNPASCYLITKRVSWLVLRIHEPDVSFKMSQFPQSPRPTGAAEPRMSTRHKHLTPVPMTAPPRGQKPSSPIPGAKGTFWAPVLAFWAQSHPRPPALCHVPLLAHDRCSRTQTQTPGDCRFGCETLDKQVAECVGPRGPLCRKSRQLPGSQVLGTGP